METFTWQTDADLGTKKMLIYQTTENILQNTTAHNNRGLTSLKNQTCWFWWPELLNSCPQTLTEVDFVAPISVYAWI